MQSNNQKSLACIAHLGAFSKYFIPFGNFIVPLCLWVSQKKDDFIAEHSRQSLNFQISLFLYLAILGALALAGVLFFGINLASLEGVYIKNDSFAINISDGFVFTPFIIYLGVILTLALGLFVFEILCVIQAAIQAGEGKKYTYPLCISFIKENNVNQNETFNNYKNQPV